MNLQNEEQQEPEEPEPPVAFTFMLNRAGNVINGVQIPYDAMKDAVKRFNETRGVTAAEVAHPDPNGSFSPDAAFLRYLVIEDNTRAALIDKVTIEGDENDWRVNASVLPNGPYLREVLRRHDSKELAFGIRAMSKLSGNPPKIDELQIICWDLISPEGKQ